MWRGFVKWGVGEGYLNLQDVSTSGCGLLMLGLPYIYHIKRGHFPVINNEKQDISAAKGVSKYS
jgi:hypothetical protein